MQSKVLGFAICATSLLFPYSTRQVGAEEHPRIHFAGVLNDYTPVDPTIKGSPYEMHGSWSVDVHSSGVADFYADMTMADYGMTDGVLDPLQGGQNAHTHHIKLSRVKVTWDTTGCPAYSPATTMGFQLNGTVSVITGNGGTAPFETTPPTSTLQVCVSGGDKVPYSNMSMVFGGPATKHFGTQAVHGVVRDACPEGGRKGQ